MSAIMYCRNCHERTLHYTMTFGPPDDPDIETECARCNTVTN